MKIQITKKEAVALFRTQASLARALGITRQAISQWGDNDPIPQVQAYKIRYQLRPECFEKTA